MGSTSADYKVQNNQISSQNEEIVGQQCQHLQRQGHNQAVQKENHLGMSVQMMMGQAATRQLAKSAVLVMAAMVLGTGAVHADEYGRETEAPTMFTGETTMVRENGAKAKLLYDTTKKIKKKNLLSFFCFSFL